MRHVIINIDRLVLHGFRPADKQAIAAGLEHELRRIFADQGSAALPRGLEDMSRLNAGSVALVHDTNPRQVGTAVAQRVAGEIGK
jgi:hypothetical protein